MDLDEKFLQKQMFQIDLQLLKIFLTHNYLD